MPSCPMTNKAVAEYSLTDKQVKTFCDKGCSVGCRKLFEAYVKRLRKAKTDGTLLAHIGR